MEGMRSLAVLTAAALVSLALAPAVAAVTSVSLDLGLTERVVVPAGGFQAYGVRLADTDVLRMDVRSASGIPMDVYALNSTNFLAYVRGFPVFEWIPSASSENAASVLVDFRPARDGNYYVVVDNRAYSPTGATPLGDLEASVVLGRPLATMEPNWAAVAVLVGIGLAFLAALVASYLRPGWHERPWIRQSWSGPATTRRTAPAPVGDLNAFSDGPRRH